MYACTYTNLYDMLCWNAVTDMKETCCVMHSSSLKHALVLNTATEVNVDIMALSIWVNVIIQCSHRCIHIVLSLHVGLYKCLRVISSFWVCSWGQFFGKRMGRAVTNRVCDSRKEIWWVSSAGHPATLNGSFNLEFYWEVRSQWILYVLSLDIYND